MKLYLIAVMLCCIPLSTVLASEQQAQPRVSTPEGQRCAGIGTSRDRGVPVHNTCPDIKQQRREAKRKKA